MKLHVSVSLSDAVLLFNLLCCYSEISYCQYECNIALFTLIVTFPRAKKQKKPRIKGGKYIISVHQCHFLLCWQVIFNKINFLKCFS